MSNLYERSLNVIPPVAARATKLGGCKGRRFLSDNGGWKKTYLILPVV